MQKHHYYAEQLCLSRITNVITLVAFLRNKLSLRFQLPSTWFQSSYQYHYLAIIPDFHAIEQSVAISVVFLFEDMRT